jgi:hypothetical protein
MESKMYGNFMELLKWEFTDCMFGFLEQRYQNTNDLSILDIQKHQQTEQISHYKRQSFYLKN